jgi:transposase InsO family protein
MQIFFLGGAKYFISFIDDYFGYTYVYHLKQKFEAFAMFQAYKAFVEKQNDCVIKLLYIDNGGEYYSFVLKPFCTTQAILHQFTIPYTPKQINGIVGCKNQTLVKATHNMIHIAQLPKYFWA